MIARNEAAYRASADTLSDAENIAALRRLSYMCNLAHWGVMPLNDVKRAAYTKSRDYYRKAEALAFDDHFRTLEIPFQNKNYPANLHLPKTQTAVPLIILVHGIDGCKEEHLATELALCDAGFAVLGYDGPGQAEALLLRDQHWSDRYPEVFSAIIDTVENLPEIDASRIGVMGMSIGATWAITRAATDHRIKAIYDLGAAINSTSFTRVPFIIKTKVCQITGARTNAEIREVLNTIRIDIPEVTQNIRAVVRVVHGSADRIVSLADKQWFYETLKAAPNCAGAELRVFDGADHCCTAEIPELRRDMCDFFTRHLGAATAAPLAQSSQG